MSWDAISGHTFRVGHLLSKLVSGTGVNGEVNEFHRLCAGIASISVRRKIYQGKLNPAIIGLSGDDIALDCVADLFARSPDGTFTEILGYFESQRVDVGSLSERELMSHVRRLVFSTVNDGLFRIYGEIDPALSKIIRNIKLGIRKSTTWEIRSIFDDPYLCCMDAEIADEKPEPGPAELEHIARKALLTGRDIPGILDYIGDCIRNQDAYRRRLPLIPLALAIKTAYLEHDPGDAPGTGEPPDTSLHDDILRTVGECCSNLARTLRAKYVSAGKLSDDEFNAYWRAIPSILRCEYLGDGESRCTYFRYLRGELPELTRESYGSRHRALFEYQVILARRKVRETLRGI